VDAGTLAALIKQRLPSLQLDAAALAPGLAAIAARWPDATLTTEFAQHIADRLAQQRDPQGALARVRLDDLYLAWWAGTGAAGGLAAFEAGHGGELDRIASRFRDLPRDELAQQLRIRLFVGDEAAIRDYAGQGTLLSWLRVVATRFFIDVQRASRPRDRPEQLDDIELLGLPMVDGVGESELGAELRATLKRAFEDAVGELEPRQRTFLRHAYLARLTLDQIADLYSIHRATVARVLAAARAQLIERTRAAIRSRIGVSPSDLARDLGTLDRRLELSLSRILREP
jgi:RNA polymerase sigma-70 factor (ECF subfamily)